MDINTILLSVLLVVASVLCGVGIWALTEGVKTARSAKALSDDMDERMVPLLEKADVTIDALNAELLRVDTILSRVEEVTERVESTSRTVQGVANAPGEIVTDIADRVRRAWKRRQTEGGPTAGSGSQHSEAAHDEDVSESNEAPEPPAAPEPPVWPTTVAEDNETATDDGSTAAEDSPV